MQPVTLPPIEFAICKVREWALFRLHDGRLVAHRKAKETVRKGEIFSHPELFIEWPSASDDIPEATRKEFAESASAWSMGLA